ncbi:hypothetical protein [Roseivirga sp.]|uniref:hypothetical protein n=1 Tax=Roseivirga sp. TaxID=1964215 RepID=UPI002B26F353|nr:hypothetical protein [Roseivirga sp.]
MKLRYIITMLLAILVIQGCSTADDSDPKDDGIRTQDITTSNNGYTLVHFRSERQSVDLDNPAESIHLSKLSDNYYFSANPTKLGIDQTGQAFFQNAPNSSISLRVDMPWNALWLDDSGALQSGAVNGLNYVFFDDDQDEVFETIFMLRLNASEAETASKTYIAAKVVKEDGSAIDFTTGKALLDTLEK